jgi:hypothetical protein
MCVAANYEIRIKGRVGDSVLLSFEGLTVTTEPVETILYGPVADQEALHELLAKIQSLGLEVIELRRLPGEGETSTIARLRKPPDLDELQPKEPGSGQDPE